MCQNYFSHQSISATKTVAVLKNECTPDLIAVVPSDRTWGNGLKCDREGLGWILENDFSHRGWLGIGSPGKWPQHQV